MKRHEEHLDQYCLFCSFDLFLNCNCLRITSIIWYGYVCMYGITFQIMIVKVNILFFRFNINYKSKWKVNCCWKRILLSLKRPRFWEDFTLSPWGCLGCKVPGSPLFLPCHVGGSESDSQLEQSNAVSCLSSLLTDFKGE